MGAYRYVSAVSAEILDGMLPEKRLPPRALCRNVLIRTPELAGRSHDGRGTYSLISLVSAVMLAGIGPVKLFWIKLLITHSEGCGRAERSANALAQRGRPAWAARNPKARTQPCTCAAQRGMPRLGGSPAARRDAHASERSERGDRRRHAAGEAVTAEGPVPQRAQSHARVGRKVARR